MKISKIEIHHLKIKLNPPYKLSKLYGTLHNTQPIVVKITTDEGVFGFGETNPWALFTGETPETVVVVLEKYLAPILIGEDPLNIANIHMLMDSTIKDMHVAKAAIDMAVYDILGKTAKVSVSNILGGRIHKSLPIMGSIGGGSAKQNANDVLKAIKDVGYKSFMIKVGSEDVEHDVKRVQAIRQAVGSSYPLIVDANQAWDLRSALKFLKKIENCNIELMEQPVPAWDIDGLKKIKDNTDVLISADESVLSMENAKLLIKEKAVDIFSIKVSKNGGIFQTKKIVELANNFGIDCLFNSMIEEGITQAASFAIGSSSSNLYEYGHAYFSPLRLEDDITNFSQYINNGEINLPEKPGLGIEVNEEKIKKYTINKIIISKKKNEYKEIN